MRRNLSRRVEVLFPVENPRLKAALREILFVHLRDSRRARRLQSDGSWTRVKPSKGEQPLDSQLYMLEQRGTWHGREPVTEPEAPDKKQKK
jgi:polyphosphate kinase